MYCFCHGSWGDSHGDLEAVSPVKGKRGRQIVQYLRQGEGRSMLQEYTIGRGSVITWPCLSRD